MNRYLKPIQRTPEDRQHDENSTYDCNQWYLDWMVLWPSDWNAKNSPGLTQMIAEDLAIFAAGYGPYWETISTKMKYQPNASKGAPVAYGGKEPMKDLIQEYYLKRDELIKRMDGDKSKAMAMIEEEFLDMFGSKPPTERLGTAPTVHEIIHLKDWGIQ
ncbi:MAG: hypothetical protein OXF08_01665 [Bacteroidetes bacterium]|nr:hypothetical protein [Bacteroidota bacterium]